VSTGTIAGANGLTPLSAVTASPDPQAAYRRLREAHGVVAPVELEPGVNAWLVTGWEEICEVVRHERIYSRDPNNWRDWQEKNVAQDSGLGPMMFPRRNAYFVDGREHHRLRAPLDDGVQDIDQRQMRVSVTRVCEDLITRFAARGEADLVGEYAAVIPILAVATSLFGLSAVRGYELQRAIVALFGSGEDAQAGNRALETIIAETMQSHRQTPAKDLTTAFQHHPNLHDDSEVAQSMVLMITAGAETTASWIAQALRLMLTHPRFRGRKGGFRPGVDDALDEVLWQDPPMANMPARYALYDTELAGQTIRRGDAIILGLMAAGSDPRVHVADPWTELGNRSHLAWSTGPHACPAQIPARIITRAAVDTAMSRLPGLKLAVPEEKLTLRPSPWTRCPASLPVTFAPFEPQPAPGPGSRAPLPGSVPLPGGAAAGRI
jgi:cytochrome P450